MRHKTITIEKGLRGSLRVFIRFIVAVDVVVRV